MGNGNDNKQLNGDKGVILGLGTIINSFSHASTKPQFSYLQNVVAAKKYSKQAKVKSFAGNNGNTQSLFSISNQIQDIPNIAPCFPDANSWIESDECREKDKWAAIDDNLNTNGRNTIQRFPSLPSLKNVESEACLESEIISKNSKTERNAPNESSMAESP